MEALRVLVTKNLHKQFYMAPELECEVLVCAQWMVKALISPTPTYSARGALSPAAGRKHFPQKINLQQPLSYSSHNQQENMNAGKKPCNVPK